jgi:hypothetical protein
MKRAHGVALVLILILLAAVVLAPVPGDTRWLRTLHNSAHAPIFGCVALLALIVIRTHHRLGSVGLAAQYVLALACAFFLGVATEILQIPTGRDATVEDAVHDLLGSLAFLAAFALFDARVRTLSQGPAMRLIAAVIAVASLSIIAAPATRAAIKYQQREQRFPVIADFSQRYDRYFILQRSADFSPAKLPAAWARSPGESALRVRLLEGPYPGLDFIELQPDWSEYSTLVVDLTNPTPLTLRLVLRVHDTRHTNQPEDRFNKRIELPAGSRTVIRIPLREIAAGPQARRLDLHQIAGLILFRAGDSPPAGELYLSRVWLE